MSEATEGQASPRTRTGPTIFARCHEWRLSFEAWLGFIQHLTVRAERDCLLLELPEPTAVNPKGCRSWRINPPPPRAVVRGIAAHPGYAAFAAVCRRLSRATAAVLPILRRFDQSHEHVDAVKRSLAKSPPLPRFEDYQHAHGLKTQLVRVADLISNGALSGKQDQRERRAYWGDVLAGLKPTTNRAAVAAHIDALLQSPRVPQRELDLLNGIRVMERKDALDAELSLIIDADQSTQRARHERWRALKEWGLRQYRDTAGDRTHLKLPVSERTHHAYGANDPLPHCLRWGIEMLASTDALHAAAKDAGFDATGLQPIHVVIRHVRSLLDGDSIDLRAPVLAVDLIVDELVKRAEEPPRPTRPAPDSGGQSGETPAVGPTLEFDAFEKAVVLLLRDGRRPRSMRLYAKEVGVHHTTLGRNAKWQQAWHAAQQLAQNETADLPVGSKSADGTLEAWKDEVCENCRQHPIVRTMTVQGETLRVCEDCGTKHEARTSSRTK